MGGDERPSQRSVDIAIEALDKGRRAGWAKAYRLEGELAQTRRELARMIQQAEESRRISEYASAVLKTIAPSLVPWLNGGGPGVSTFGWGNGPAFGDDLDYFAACSTDDIDDLRRAGQRDATSWLALDNESRQRQDWRADQVLTWYEDRDADTPSCGRCECASWDHTGPRHPCIKCECACFMAVDGD